MKLVGSWNVVLLFPLLRLRVETARKHFLCLHSFPKEMISDAIELPKD
jgi:hypothetical protein